MSFLLKISTSFGRLEEGVLFGLMVSLQNHEERMEYLY